MKNIKKEVKRIIKKYGTNNPFELCERLGIWVYILPLGHKVIILMLNEKKYFL